MKKTEIKVLGFTTKQQQFALRTQNSSLTVGKRSQLNKELLSLDSEFQLAQLAFDIHEVGSQLGLALNLDLKSIQIEILGEVESFEVPSSEATTVFRKVEVVVKPSTEQSIVKLKEWMDALKKHSEVFVGFHHSVPTVLTLVKEYEVGRVA